MSTMKTIINSFTRWIACVVFIS